jgi:cardiolipin synthase A/B
MPPLKGNRLRLITEAEEMLASLIRDIDAATSHCHLLYYLWMRGGMGVAVGEALVRAATRGVECRVLVDAVGARPFLRSAMADRLRSRGVQVLPALPVSPLRMLFYRLDLRNHRKLAVIDGRIAYAGSQNLADSTFRSTRRIATGPWIDATLRIEGPAAQALAVVFLMDWQLDSDEDMSNIDPYMPDLGEPEHIESVVQVVPSGPGRLKGAGGIQQALLTAIYSAREELIITSPYFVPDEATKSAIISAALRGIQVTIILPLTIDSPMVALASRAHFAEFLEAGVRLAQYPKGLLHAKTITVDRRIAVIGSANLDARSFYLNFEITLFVYDDDVASVIRFMQADFLENSIELTPDAWASRPMSVRVFENLFRLMGPLL